MGFGGEVKIVVKASLPEIPQPLTDGLVGERGDPQTDKGFGTAEIVVHVTENQLSLTTCVGGDDDGFAPVEQLPEHFQLPDHSGIVLVHLILPHLTGYKPELLRQYGEVFPVEAGKAVAFGHGKTDQMPECPCYGISVPIRYPSFRWRVPTTDAMPCATLGFSAMITFI